MKINSLLCLLIGLSVTVHVSAHGGTDLINNDSTATTLDTQDSRNYLVETTRNIASTTTSYISKTRAYTKTKLEQYPALLPISLSSTLSCLTYCTLHQLVHTWQHAKIAKDTNHKPSPPLLKLVTSKYNNKITYASLLTGLTSWYFIKRYQ